MSKGKLKTRVNGLQARLDQVTEATRARAKADETALTADMMLWFDGLPFETRQAFERQFTDADKQPGDDDLIAAAWAALPQDLGQRSAELNQRMQGLGLVLGGEG